VGPTSHFLDAGLSIVRAETEGGRQLWARFDHGPLGYLSTAAHGHADALSVELRIDGTPILIDPGTYCYHGEPEWRNYFRGTSAHNTVTLGNRDQSDIAGPFLWSRHANARLVRLDRHLIVAEHDGYESTLGVTHRRTIGLDRGRLTIVDEFDGAGAAEIPAEVHFHCGAGIEVSRSEVGAELRWTEPGGGPLAAAMTLEPDLDWTIQRGEIDPISGWWSPDFGSKHPTHTLTGHFDVSRKQRVVTILELDDSLGRHEDRLHSTEPSLGEHS
jgi:hypothetical protein